MSVGAGANKTPFCLRQGEVAVIALNRSYLDGKCWLERQKVLRNGADTAQAEYQLRADSNLLDEIQKRSDLRRREVARGMIGIERIEFFRPFRQDLDKFASRQERRQADREALENALTGQAGCYRDGRIIQH
jgi:hypothetical protein